MESIKIIFLVILLTVPLTVSAQTPITYGTIEISSGGQAAVSPTQIYRYFSIYSPQNNLHANANNDIGDNEVLLSFLANRSVSGITHSFNLTENARGDILGDGGGCQNVPFTHPNQPLSTVFVMTLADFRVPKFPKVSSAPNAAIDITVPFTMTGRLSCLGTGGALIFTIPVSGTGNARLRFKRGTVWNRLYVVDAMYNFGTYPAVSRIE